MVAFATNSLLCREALHSNAIGVVDFTAARLVSGAVTLWFLVALTSGQRKIAGNWLSAAALFAYAACFSFAYVSLSAGTGALLLFGAVQMAMISWGLLCGEQLTALKWTGVLSAFLGLVWFLFPGIEAPPLWGAVLMVAAGVFWAVYSVRGQGSTSPTSETAGNFLRSIPMVAVLYLVPIEQNISATSQGWMLAIASGALASGLGYALWYQVLTKLSSSTSATVQLSVPIIASVGGVLFLAEPFSICLAIASAVVLGGIFLFINAGRHS